MSKTATLVDGDVPGFAGPARRYALSEPLAGHDEVIVFAVDAFGQQETIVTPVSGPSIKRLPGSISGYLNHEYALFVAGYALVEEEVSGDVDSD